MSGILREMFEDFASLSLDDVPFKDIQVLRTTFYCGALTTLRILDRVTSGRFTEAEARAALLNLAEECDAYFFRLMQEERRN